MIEKEFDKYLNKQKGPRVHTIISVMVAEWQAGKREHCEPQWNAFTEEYCTMLCNAAAEMEPGRHLLLHSADLSHYLEMGSQQMHWWLDNIPAAEDDSDSASLCLPMRVNIATCVLTLQSL